MQFSTRYIRTRFNSKSSQKGPVEKIRNPGGPRTYIKLTEKGTDIYDNTVTERSIILIFDALEDEEKKQLSKLLAKLQKKARNVLGLDYVPPFLQRD